MGKWTPSRLIVLLLIVLSLLVAGVGSYVIYYRPAIRASEVAQERREADQLKYLELLERSHEVTGNKFTPAEAEELRQLRERAAKRRIERGY